jgi:predicted transcriptional regulator
MQNRIMSRRRSSIDILHEILMLCDNGGVKKTTIMYRGNLSYDQIRRYLTVLTTREIVARNDAGDYQVTAKGQQILSRVSSVVGVLSDLRTELVAESDSVPAVQSGFLEKQAVSAY